MGESTAAVSLIALRNGACWHIPASHRPKTGQSDLAVKCRTQHLEHIYTEKVFIYLKNSNVTAIL